MKFIVQDIPVPWDFIMELYRSDEYWSWKGDSIEIYKDPLPESIDSHEVCPVGSVEFVTDWYKKVWGLDIKPRNIPIELQKSQHRVIKNYTLPEDLNGVLTNFGHNSFYLKSSTVIKSSINDVYWSGDSRLTEIFDQVIVSEYMGDIVSEWRCFVYNSRIIDVKNYRGDPWTIPNKDRVLQYISEFELKSPNIPPAYTLDIAVRENGVIDIIEIHDFFSCGLYGFSDYSKYPYMLWRWFKWFTK